MISRLQRRIGLFLALTVLIAGHAAMEQHVKNGCLLTPAIDATSCHGDGENQYVIPGLREGSDGRGFIKDDAFDDRKITKALALRMSESYFGKSSRTQHRKVKVTSSFKVAKDSKMLIPHSVTCRLKPEYGSSTVYSCQNGKWTIVGLAKKRFERSNYRVISERRSRRRCKRSWWGRKKCWNECYTESVRDYYPTIKCPTIENTFTDIRQTAKLVTWQPAQATDPEDGNIDTQQTDGPNPNSVLEKGSYTVSYQAKDRRGSTATCSVTFKVEVRTCPNPGQKTQSTFSEFTWFPNGNIFCSHNNIYGSVCTFSCSSNYEISGASKAQCQESGLWDQEKPTCILRKCLAPAPVLNGKWTACNSHTYLSQCTLACDSGYNVFGNTTITCQSDKTWTTPAKCQDSEVPQIACPPDTSIFSLPKKQPVQVLWNTPVAVDNSGDPVSVTSSHQSGEYFPPGNTTVVFQARDTSDNIAVCSMHIQVEVKYCSPLSAPREGQISCSHGNAVGSECSFSCPEGYQMIGVSTRTCLDAKDWSDSQPSCEKKSCGSPPYVANGNYSCPDSHFYGDTCSLKCDTGYLPTSSLTITCGVTSKWSAAGSCEDTKAPKFPKGCPDVSSYASTFGQQTYVLYPTPEVTDNSGGRVTVTSDITSGSEFNIGSTNVTFTAEDMSGNIATCIFTVTVIQIECQNPVNTDLDNSKDKVMRFSCPNGHVFGASCSITCSDKSPLGGQSTITCEQNGTSTGYWWYGNVKPFCDAKTCPAPEEPTYGAVACDVLADREFCTVFCQKGHSFPKVDLQSGGFLCLRTTGQWIPREISSRMCFPGRAASSVDLMPDIYYYSDSCSADSDEIKQKFLAIINSTSIFSSICGSKNITCTVDTVTVTCGERAKRSVSAVSGSFVDSWNPHNKRSSDIENAIRSGQLLLRSKRDVDTATSITSLVFEIKMSYEFQSDSSDTIKFYDDLSYDLNVQLNDAVAAGEFDIPEAGETHAYSYGFSDEKFKCQEPTLFQAQTAMCTGCGQGYIYVSQSKPCDVCPVGTYQPENEGTECLSCPDGYSTMTDASNSSSDCIALCPPGTYSKTGLEPCDTCRRGSYQSGTGKNSCDFCPYGMSTTSDGHSSKDECTFYQVKFINDGSSIDLGMKDQGQFNFTLVTWVRSPSDLTETETSFSLSGDPGDASFGCGDLTVYIAVSQNPGSRNRRQWYHLVLTGLGDRASLYVNGELKDSKVLNAFCHELLLDFSSSIMLKELVLSGLQISNMVLTQEQVASMTLSCNQILEGNILVATERHVDSLNTPSFCDDTNNCVDSPCGPKGTCIDMIDSYRCDCDSMWSGDNCEIEPDFCKGHQCENNAECVNQVENGNYTCACTEDYRGRLCSEKIVHGGWSSWSAWPQCSVTCDNGTHSRYRTCDSPSPGPDGKMCEGPGEETRTCFLVNCPVDGALGGWTPWVCPVTCGEGTSTRTRKCNNPAPAYGGNDCVGALLEAKDCENLEPCPIDGAYGNYSDWSPCSKSCKVGIRIRERTCDSPAPQYGGAPCDPDQATESKPCNEEDCPVCKRLIRPRGNIDTLSCTYNETEDMNECRIVCKKGYMTDEEKTYICGRATNFTWSHVTPTNPRGLLPDCEEATVPKSFAMTVSVEYPEEDLTSETVVTSLETKLNEKINCTSCTYSVETPATSTRAKRDAALAMFLTLLVQMPNPDMDPKTATDEQLAEMMGFVIDFDMAAQALADNSNYIFAVLSNSRTIMPNPSSVSEKVEINCPVGTEVSGGVCVNCGAGYYSISVYFGCQLCPKGYYQNNVRSTSCKPCPADTSTAGLGGRSLEDCVEDPSIYYPDYIKDYFDVDVPEDFDREKEKERHDTTIALIVGSAVGITVFIIVMTFGLYVLYKKFLRTTSSPQVAPLSHYL